MPSLRIDKILVSSIYEAFRNREKKTGTIVISGSVGAGNTATFTSTLNLTRNFGVAEVYYQKSTSTNKRRADSGIYLYDFSGSGTASIQITYPTATQLQVTISVFNPTGGSISLTTQTYNIEAFIFDTPFSF